MGARAAPPFADAVRIPFHVLLVKPGFFPVAGNTSITQSPEWGQEEVIHLRNLPVKVLDSRGAVRAGDTTSSPR